MIELFPAPKDHRGIPFDPASDTELIEAKVHVGQPGFSDQIFSWPPGRQHVVPLTLLLISIVLAVCAGLVIGLTNPPWLVRIPLYAPVPLVWVVYAHSPLARRVQRLFASRIVTAAIERGHCPQCLYQLDGLTPDADSCTLCPECGAACKLPVPQPGATTDL